MSEKFQEALDKAKELETVEIPETGVDINDYYSAIEQIAIRNNEFKSIEAENIIKEQASSSINQDFITELDAKRLKIENFIRTYDPNKEIVKNFKVSDVDKVYAISNYLLNSYVQYVNEMTFNFEMTKEEFKFINKILTREIEYDADEVFNFVEFYNNLWASVQTLAEDNKANESFVFVADIKKILILHHLIKSYKVKGNTNDFINFKSVLYKIAQFNKLFNAYSIVIERMKDDSKIWGAALDVVANEKEAEETQAEVVPETTDVPAKKDKK